MSTSVTPQSGWDDLGKLILRVTVAVLLLFHGIAKVKGGVGFISGLLAQNGLPAFIAYGVYVGEVVAPLLLILGVLTRPAALIIAFNMLMAIFLARRDAVFAVNERGGAWGIEVEAFFLFGALAVFFLGPGRFAIARGQTRWM